MKKSRNKIKFLRGVAALEFAIIFIPLFLLMYGMLSYSLIFAAQNSLTQSAAEGARTALQFISASDSIQDRKTAACRQAAHGVEWLKNFGEAITVTCNPIVLAQCIPENPAIQCLSVSMDLSGHMLPKIFLPIPDQLNATAVSHITLKY